MNDLRYYLWGLDILDESSTKSVFCGVPRSPSSTPVLSSYFRNGLALVKKFTMLHHNGVYYRSLRVWEKQPCAGDTVFLRSGDLCEVETFLLDLACKEAKEQKLFVASFPFVRVEDETQHLVVRRVLLPTKKILSVSKIDCAAALYPTTSDDSPSWRVLRLSHNHFLPVF